MVLKYCNLIKIFCTFVLFLDLVVINSELELELNPGAEVGWSNYTPGAGSGRDAMRSVFSLCSFLSVNNQFRLLFQSLKKFDLHCS